MVVSSISYLALRLVTYVVGIMILKCSSIGCNRCRKVIVSPVVELVSPGTNIYQLMTGYERHCCPAPCIRRDIASHRAGLRPNTGITYYRLLLPQPPLPEWAPSFPGGRERMAQTVVKIVFDVSVEISGKCFKTILFKMLFMIRILNIMLTLEYYIFKDS